MNIHYTLDDSAARLPLAIRSADQVRDRFSELRNSAGVQLVEMATQHMVGTSATLFDELVHYFEHDTRATEADPYALVHCYDNRDDLDDLLRDMHDVQPGLAALHEVAELFPVNLNLDVQFTLALTVVGSPAFGYVRTYKDSEGDEFHGIVVNLAHARTHVEQLTGQYSRDRLISTIRYGFFNHEGFLLAYSEYADAIGRNRERVVDRLKNGLLARGIAWYLSYRHDQDLYDTALSLSVDDLPEHVRRCNTLLSTAPRKRGGEPGLDDWPQPWESHEPRHTCIDVVGYLAARTIAEERGDDGLREAIRQGPDHFITMYNALGKPRLALTEG